jgi:tRNA uridine 5-carbamoylmethylation protein Kti12
MTPTAGVPCSNSKENPPILPEQGSTTTTTVVLLCGLPGSGKSSLAKWLVARCKGPTTDVCHVEYDAVEGELLLYYEQAIMTASKNGVNNSKDHKEVDGSDDYPKSTKKYFDPKKNNDDAETDFSREIWKRSRSRSLEVLNEHLESPQQKQHKIIIMDDNFHLRSMRREIYKLCQDRQIVADETPCKSIYFLILWLDVSKECCLERNQQRERQVPAEVVERMSGTLEPPGKEHWEQYYLKLQDVPVFLDNADSKKQQQDATDLTAERILEFITVDCQTNKISPVPPPPPPIDLEQLEEERRKTRESWLHSWDQRLRSWVGAVAKVSRRDTPKANKARKQLLQRLRQEQQDQHNEVPTNSQIATWFLEELSVQWTEDVTERFHREIQRD